MFFVGLERILMDIKPYLTIDEQLELLKSRGLFIESDNDAKMVLSKFNYYRLSGYMLTLKKNEQFYDDATFDGVMQIYNFDRELKNLLLLWLEDVEISLRTHIAYILGADGATSYMNESTFASKQHQDEFLSELKTALADNKNEAFIKHHKSKYNGIIPIWVAVETLSFGAVSRLFTSLNPQIKDRICDKYYYGLHSKYISNWFECLVVLRNLCAHHSRLFNRGLPNTIKFAAKDFNFLLKSGYESNAIGKKVVFPIIILERLAPDFTNEFFEHFQELQDKYSFVDIKHYGFIRNWETIIEDVNIDFL